MDYECCSERKPTRELCGALQIQKQAEHVTTREGRRDRDNTFLEIRWTDTTVDITKRSVTTKRVAIREMSRAVRYK